MLLVAAGGKSSDPPVHWQYVAEDGSVAGAGVAGAGGTACSGASKSTASGGLDGRVFLEIDRKKAGSGFCFAPK